MNVAPKRAIEPQQSSLEIAIKTHTHQQPTPALARRNDNANVGDELNRKIRSMLTFEFQIRQLLYRNEINLIWTIEAIEFDQIDGHTTVETFVRQLSVSHFGR